MTLESVETAIIINKGGRPQNPDRHLPDGSYNSKPFDPRYFKKYCQERVKGRPVECVRCGGLGFWCFAYVEESENQEMFIFLWIYIGLRFAMMFFISSARAFFAAMLAFFSSSVFFT